MFVTTIKSSMAILLVVIALTMGVLVAGSPMTQAGQGCPVIPAVRWWNDVDQQKMMAYVEARHGGDWDAYIAKWQNHLKSVRAVHTRGGAMFSRKLNTRIQGKILYEYIQSVETRLSITRCLAKQEMAKDSEILQGLETASGGEEPLPDTIR